MSEQGFAERERLALAAWEFFSGHDADEMTHEFRGGYHQGFIDGHAAGEKAGASAAAYALMSAPVVGRASEPHVEGSDHG